MKGKSVLGLALAAALPASAVTLNTDGLGQALIYPYYTVQSSGSDPYNTYISVVNHTGDAKALRLRLREGRLGKSVLDMNVYLSPNDVWTGAVVPFSSGTRLVSTDLSCTQPRFAVTVAPGDAPFIDFRNDAFSGANEDGAGTGLDRTREGFVEILEMATLTGASAAAVTHNAAGVPSNCAALDAGAPLVAAPSGGLSGTLTIINVANGLDFNLNAEALDSLAQRPYFRGPSDPYPDFNAAEIDPVSVVKANGVTYRSTWDNPVDAVSAVLMRTAAIGEYVLDQATASQTDFVLALPTRHFHANATAAAAPFTAANRWEPKCFGGAEVLSVVYFNRDERSATVSNPDFATMPPIEADPGICASVGITSIRNPSLSQAIATPVQSTAVFGSITRGLPGTNLGMFQIASGSLFQGGWIRMTPTSVNARNGMTSGAASTRVRDATGELIVGPHVFHGLPMLGFAARIFRNGALRCDSGTCQGNYGGAFPFKYLRNITPAS